MEERKQKPRNSFNETFITTTQKKKRTYNEPRGNQRFFTIFLWLLVDPTAAVSLISICCIFKLLKVGLEEIEKLENDTK